MGKRKKTEIRISDEELKATTIGYLEEEKKGFFGLILLFVIFILFAIFLPNINTYINKLLGKENPNVIIKEPNKDNEEQQNNEEIKMYDLEEDLSFTYNDIKFSKFTLYKSENISYLSFDLENNSNNVIDFTESKYYIETYSQDKTLLSRYIFNNSKLNIKSTLTQSLELNNDESDKISKIVIMTKTDKDYPEVSLKENDNEYLLSCNKNINIIEYTFDKNNNLLRIKDSINNSNDNSANYKSNLLKYQNQVANYNNKNGVSSSLVEISTGFTVTTDIQVKMANIKELANDNYYEYEIIPKVVKFEMESRGYNCN